MTNPDTDAVEALLNYEQADMDGVIVKASRQAIHEVVDRLRQAEAKVEKAAAQFEHYAQLHFAKNTIEGDAKGKRNQELADELRTPQGGPNAE